MAYFPGTEDQLLSLPPVLWGSLLPCIQLPLPQLCFQGINSTTFHPRVPWTVSQDQVAAP